MPHAYEIYIEKETKIASCEEKGFRLKKAADTHENKWNEVWNVDQIVFSIPIWGWRKKSNIKHVIHNVCMHAAMRNVKLSIDSRKQNFSLPGFREWVERCVSIYGMSFL